MFRRTVMNLGRLGFVVMGTAILLLSQQRSRMVGLAMLLIGGIPLVIELLPWLLERAGGTGLRDGSVTASGRRLPALLIDTSLGQQAGGLVFVLTFGMAGLAMATNPEQFRDGPFGLGTEAARVFGWIVFLFFAALSGLAVWWQPRGIALTPEGVVLRHVPPLFVPWSEIEELAPFTRDTSPVTRERLLGALLTSSAANRAELAKRIDADRAAYGWDLAYPLGRLAVTSEVAEAVIGYYHAHPDARDRLGQRGEAAQRHASSGPSSAAG